MKTSLRSLCAFLTLAVALLTTSAGAQQQLDFTKHAFFKHLIGEWRAKGDLKGADGNITTLKEEWKGSVTGEGAFVIEGKRELNKDMQDYRWTICATATSGLFEVTYFVNANGGQTLRFEASVSEADLTMELSAPLGEGTLKITDSFPGSERDTLLSKVNLTDGGGKTTLSGTITNKRVKKQ